MNDNEIKILTKRLIPAPQRIKFIDGPEYKVSDGCAVTLNVAEIGELDAMATAWFQAYWQTAPEINVKAAPKARGLAPEAYAITVSETEVSITVNGGAGLLNAMKTLRQLAEVNRGTQELSGYFWVQCEIDDFPAMAFRGIHLCIFPETQFWDIEKQVRLAAYHKFNYAVIETWGVFPFASHPGFCWADRQMDKSELKRLIRLGRALGITLIPQLNLLGHATASRVNCGKHAVLDCNPALQPLFEPNGWTWCLSNPHVRSVLTDLVVELYEFYERPPFFHIGCDEAYDIGTCRDCRRYALHDLVRDHIVYFHDLLQKRGARVIMWHDMLVENGDPRWQGYIACGRPENRLSQLYKDLPHDIVIADWQYNYPETNDGAEPQWPTARLFHAEKFPVLLCPWLDKPAMESQGKMVAKENMLGMLETTWHNSHDRLFSVVFGTAACAAWNPSVVQKNGDDQLLVIAHHLRQIGGDMKLSGYEKAGFSQYQVDAGHHPHQLF